MKNILEIDSIQKYVNKDFSLSDIYLRCETGEILRIFGRNGSGKSLLMKIIFGTEKADHKFIRINNKCINEPYKAADNVVYLPQNSFLPKNLSLQKILKLYLDKDCIKDFEDDEIIKKINASKINELSGGELRYLELKLLLKSKAKFILLDEPLNALSPILKEKAIELIINEKATKGIIITDHDYNNINSIATQNYLMHQGSLKKITSNEDLIFYDYLPNSF